MVTILKQSIKYRNGNTTMFILKHSPFLCKYSTQSVESFLPARTSTAHTYRHQHHFLYYSKLECIRMIMKTIKACCFNLIFNYHFGQEQFLSWKYRTNVSSLPKNLSFWSRKFNLVGKLRTIFMTDNRNMILKCDVISYTKIKFYFELKP